MEDDKLNNKALSKWKKAKRIAERTKDFETSNKLNQFIKTKNTEEKLSILDGAIERLEDKNMDNREDKLNNFKDILGKESFYKSEGKAQVIGLDIKKESEETIYERLGITENDDMQNYQVFKLLTEKTEEQQDKKENKEGFHSIHSILEEARYFQVPEKINWMLLNTKNKVSEIRLPYIYMFFDTKFIIGERIYYGLLLGDISQLREIAEKSKEVKHEDLVSLGEGIIIQTFYEEENKFGWVKLRLYEKERNKGLNKLKEYIMNLIYFINSEDVKVMVHTRSEKNAQRRIQNNKVPLPSYNKIQIIGYLAKYLEKVENKEIGVGKGFTHRFTVRGHWRHFWNKKFDNLYKMYNAGNLKNIEGKQYLIDGSGALKVWIFPYIKGQGILINKDYKLE